MRWPKQKTKNNQNKERKRKKKKKKHKNTQNTQKYQKTVFQLSIKFFFFWWVSPKHYKDRGFREHIFGKQLCVTKQPFLDPKTPNPKIPVIIFWSFFFSFNNKNTKMLRNPDFYSVLASQKKRFFQKSSQNTDNLKPKCCTLFLKKANFRKAPDSWTKNKNTK